MSQFYVNLTQGLYHPLYVLGMPACYIQSTDLEQKRWGRVLWGAGPDLWWSAAWGAEPTILDCSAGADGCARVLWQGVPFLNHVARRLWKLPERAAYVRACNCTKYFDEVLAGLPQAVRSYVRSFRRYLPAVAPGKFGPGLIRPGPPHRSPDGPLTQQGRAALRRYYGESGT